MRKREKDAEPAEFRPKLGGRIRQGPQRFAHSVLARVSSFTPAGQRAAGGPRGGHPKRGKSPCDVRTPKAFYRRVVVKARVVRMNAAGRKAAALHLAYIERDGVERNGSAGQLYGDAGPISSESFPAVADGERHQFRLIVSPEDAHELELTEYTRTLMRQVAKDLGRQFEWAAVNHYNTDNPHAHVVVRGVDLAGKELRFDPRYISNGLRWRAQEIATAELGPRTELELDQQRRREVEQHRTTSLDRELAKLAAPDGTLQLGGPFQTDEQLRRFAYLQGRLATLERLGLASRTPEAGWSLRAGWLDELREMGMRGDVIKTMHRALKGQGDLSRYRMLEAEPGAKRLQVEGIVRRKGLADELSGTYYAVIETAQGAAYYARLHGAAVERVHEGGLVRATAVAERAVRPSDRKIADVAAAHGGVYSREAHRAELGDVQSVQVARYEGDRERLAVPVDDFLDTRAEARPASAARPRPTPGRRRPRGSARAARAGARAPSHEPRRAPGLADGPAAPGQLPRDVARPSPHRPRDGPRALRLR